LAWFHTDSFKKYVKACPGLVTCLEDYVRLSPGMKRNAILAFPVEHARCECNVDSGVLKSIAWRLLLIHHAKPCVVKTLQVNPAKSKKCTPIQFPADMPWNKVAKSITGLAANLQYCALIAGH
jgi:hypothetical protein